MARPARRRAGRRRRRHVEPDRPVRDAGGLGGGEGRSVGPGGRVLGLLRADHEVGPGPGVVPGRLLRAAYVGGAGVGLCGVGELGGRAGRGRVGPRRRRGHALEPARGGDRVRGAGAGRGGGGQARQVGRQDAGAGRLRVLHRQRAARLGAHAGRAGGGAARVGLPDDVDPVPDVQHADHRGHDLADGDAGRRQRGDGRQARLQPAPVVHEPGNASSPPSTTRWAGSSARSARR